ncbi:MAG TPA: DUF1636 family protein [Sphingomonas sp.]|nr:DUF1636 family protein [Sphingomonas sp.]
MSEMLSGTRLLVCRNCPGHDWPGSAGRAALGEQAGMALAVQLKQHLPRDAVVLRLVDCLSGCRTPCNARLSAPGKIGLWLHRLDRDDAPALAALAVAYAESEDGDLADAAWPGLLRGKLATAVLPRGAAIRSDVLAQGLWVRSTAPIP